MNHRIGVLAAALMMSVATSAVAETKAPAAGAALAKVNGVAVPAGNVREWCFTPRPAFADLAALNRWLEARCRALADPPPSDR